MKKILIFFLFSLIFAGCDYEYYYAYYVENGLEASQNNEIKFLFRGEPFELPIDQSVKFYTNTGGTSGKNHYPKDIRYRESNPYWELDSLSVYVNDSLIPLNFAEKDKWTFESKVGTGVYTLMIDTEMLEI